MKENVSLGHVGRVKLHYVTALRAILDQFPSQPRQIRKKKSRRPKTNPIYYEKGVACVAGVKRERGRANVGAPYTRATRATQRRNPMASIIKDYSSHNWRDHFTV